MPDETTEANTEPDEQQQEALSPLEAIRRAQANRVPPPGTGGQSGRGGKRRDNHPSAPKMYNRHK